MLCLLMLCDIKGLQLSHKRSLLFSYKQTPAQTDTSTKSVVFYNLYQLVKEVQDNKWC